MTSSQDPRPIEDDPELEGSAATEVELAAHDEERFLDAPLSRRAARLRFAALLAVILLVHAALIAAFLWRDRHDNTQLAQTVETPIEIIQVPPPEPVKPPPPPEKKQPPPPKPKEDLSPALSAPRAENKEKVETQKLQAKTSAPKAPTPPTEGQVAPKPQAPPPKDEAPPSPSKQDEAKEEDKTKPDAEALDKAKPKPSKQTKAKEAKAQPRRKEKTNDLFASLAGTSLSPEISFAKPTPKSRVYGGTEDVRWMAEVEGMLEDKVGKLPRTAHWQSGGHVVLFFHVDVSGRVISKDIIVKSGYPDIDAIALRALSAAAPFPPPPPGIEHGLVWSSVFDGQLPTVHVEKR